LFTVALRASQVTASAVPLAQSPGRRASPSSVRSTALPENVPREQPRHPREATYLIRESERRSGALTARISDYPLQQEFITPYTPEQNGPIERFPRSLKEECVWQHLFPNFAAARRPIAAWVR
jgi:transposase InsO family protein